MIKRTYFFSCKSPYNDGTGSYSYWCNTATQKSWFEDSLQVFDYMRKKAIDFFKSKGIEDPSIEIVAFNKV